MLSHTESSHLQMHRIQLYLVNMGAKKKSHNITYFIANTDWLIKPLKYISLILLKDDNLI